jgi:hypothetical protein
MGDSEMNNWISIDSKMPEHSKSVLACYLVGKTWRTVIAFYVGQFEMEAGSDDEWFDYNEEKDEYYLKDGWYEVIRNWEDFKSITIHEGIVRYWQPLPEAPEQVK